MYNRKVESDPRFIKAVTYKLFNLACEQCGGLNARWLVFEVALEYARQRGYYSFCSCGHSVSLFYHHKWREPDFTSGYIAWARTSLLSVRTFQEFCERETCHE